MFFPFIRQAQAGSRLNFRGFARLVKAARSAFLLGLTAASLSVASLQTAQAHPHAWYTLRTEIVNQNPSTLELDSRDYGDEIQYPTFKLAEGSTAVYGFIFHMTLDDLSSAPLLVDIQRGNIDNIYDELATNVVNAKFFSRLWLEQGKSETELDFAQSVSMLGVKDNGQGLLEISYFAPLTKPVVLNKENHLKLQTYDKPYWMDIQYPSPKDITFTQDHGCETQLEIADPDSTLRDYANSLGIDQNPVDSDFGRHFAQTVLIGCPLYN